MREARSLTEGEIALCRSVFGDAIDYDDVRIVHGRWWPFQPRNVVMAPDGNIYFPPNGALWSEDFAGETLPLQAFLIHEMTHVWQSQHWGKWYLVLMRHPFCRYRYKYQPGRPFTRYGIEQQAEIVRHLFLLRRGCVPGGAAAREQLEAIFPFTGA